MPTFNWEIDDVNGDAVEQTIEGGNLELEALETTSSDAFRWSVQVRDPRVDLRPEHGGSVQLDVTPGGLEGERGKNQDAMTLITVLMAFLFGLGFITVVLSDIYRGDLDFKTYMMITAAFLAGLGFGKSRKQ